MPAINHLHIYERVQGSTNVFRCKHSDCTSVFSKKLLKGKRARCTCGAEYILDAIQLKKKSPHCESCYDPRRATKGPPRVKPVKVLEMAEILETTLVHREEESFVPRGEEL